MKKFKFCSTPVTKKLNDYVNKECEEGHFDDLVELSAAEYRDGLNAGTVIGLVASGIGTFSCGVFYMIYDHFKNKNDEKKLREKEETAE